MLSVSVLYEDNFGSFNICCTCINKKLVQTSSAGRGGRKLDEVREKYQKACRKLHLTHNEYVLLLGAVTECEHDLRTCYLPSLLHRQQAIHQEFITSW